MNCLLKGICRIVIVFACSLVSVWLNAADTLQVVRSWWSVGVGTVTAADTYLSNQLYKGVSIDLHARHVGRYRGADRRVEWEMYDSWRYSPMLINASHSAAYMYGGLHIGYGSYYTWNLVDNLVLKAGGAVDLHGAVRYQTRNVNNIASADIEAQLMAGGGIAWHKVWRRFRLGLFYDIKIPVMGAMFVPQMGQSYYELYLSLPKGLSDVIHFASFHNRQGVNGKLGVELDFGRGTLFFSLDHDFQLWQANNILVYNNSLSGHIGFALNLVSVKHFER